MPAVPESRIAFASDPRRPAGNRLRLDVASLLRKQADGNPGMAGWLAIDCARMLVDMAEAECGFGVSPRQALEMIQIGDRLDALSHTV